MGCDVCGNNKDRLESLLDIYQTDDIKQVCPDCAKVINKQLWSIQRMVNRIQHALLKRFMRERRDTICTKATAAAPKLAGGSSE